MSKSGTIYFSNGKVAPHNVTHVVVTPSAKRISDGAFRSCRDLTTVDLGEGVEEIGEGAFDECISLNEILIPPAVRAIKDNTFSGCSELTAVNCGERLKEIREGGIS